MRLSLLLGWTLATALLALAAVAGLRADQLLTNGGFEEGTTGWQAFDATLAVVDGPRLEGQQAARLTLTAGRGDMRQPFALEPGGSYRFSGSVLLDDATVERVRLDLNWYDLNNSLTGTRSSPLLTSHSTIYQSVSTLDIAVPCNAARGEVWLLVWGDAGGTVYLDDLRLEAIGTPRPCPTATPPPTAPPPTPTRVAAPRPSPRSPRATASATPRPPGGATESSDEPSPRPTPSHGLLVNGGFEVAQGGLPVGWESYGGAFTQVARPVHGGRFAGGFASNSDSTKWIYQTVPVQAGAWYELEAHIHHNDPRVEAAFLRVSWYADSQGGGSALDTVESTARLETPADRYRLLTTGPVQAPPGAHAAKARVLLRPRSRASATIYVDDVTFRPTAPAPVGDGAGQATRSRSRRGSLRAGRDRPGEPGGETSPHAVKINEVLYDDASSGDDTALEWVELYNAGRDAIDLTGWTLGDNKETDALPEGRLSPGGFAVVAASEELLGEFPEFAGELTVVDDGKLGNGLANRGDRLVLRDADGRLADAMSYGEDTTVFDPPATDVPAGHSLERIPAGHDTDTAADFIDNPNPSPGRGLGAEGEGERRPTPVVRRGSSGAAAGSGGPLWWPWALIGGIALVGGGAGWAAWRRRGRGKTQG